MIAFHPLADIFPLVEGQDFAELVDDIREHGLHEPIVVYEDKILDGRNRYRACEAAGKEPTFTAYTGDDPVAYVVSLNLRRRHLDESQRAMVAAKLATFGHGGDRSKSPIGDLTQAKAADLLNVGKRSVERAAEVRDHGAPELVRAVEQGAVSITAAADIAGQPIDEQREIVARASVKYSKPPGPSALSKPSSAARSGSPGSRHKPTLDRFREIANIQSSWPTRHTVMTSPTRAAARLRQNTRPCRWRRSVLCPWARSPRQSRYCSYLSRPPSSKRRSRSSRLGDSPTRPLRCGRRRADSGKATTSASNTSTCSWQRAATCRRRPRACAPRRSSRPRGASTAASHEAYEIIEQMYPTLPKIELFARRTRPGWAAWGNESERPHESMATAQRGELKNGNGCDRQESEGSWVGQAAQCRRYCPHM